MHDCTTSDIEFFVGNQNIQETSMCHVFFMMWTILVLTIIYIELLVRLFAVVFWSFCLQYVLWVTNSGSPLFLIMCSKLKTFSSTIIAVFVNHHDNFMQCYIKSSLRINGNCFITLRHNERFHRNAKMGKLCPLNVF